MQPSKIHRRADLSIQRANGLLQSQGKMKIPILLGDILLIPEIKPVAEKSAECVVGEGVFLIVHINSICDLDSYLKPI